MASCLRTVSSKLNPINQAVTRRKHATLSRLEGRVRMHMLKSQFLEEFLDCNVRRADKKHCSVAVASISDQLWTKNKCILGNVLDKCSNGEEPKGRDLYYENLYCPSLYIGVMDASPNGNRTLNSINPVMLALKPFETTPDDIIIRRRNDTNRSIDCSEAVHDIFLRYTVGVQDKDKVLLSDYEKQMILLAEGNVEKNQEPEQDNLRPTEEQLTKVFNILRDNLPRLFVQPLNYSIYSNDLIFENNIRGTRSVGLYHYVRQMALLRTIGHLKFAYVKFEILKITMHPEDGTVRIRWRISGLSGLKVLATFWKYKIWKYKETMDKKELWYDGFSVFHVAGNGLVYKHVADKMMPDDEQIPAKLKDSPSLAAKLAMCLGALTPPGLPEFQHYLLTSEKSQSLSDLMLPLEKIA